MKARKAVGCRCDDVLRVIATNSEDDDPVQPFALCMEADGLPLVLTFDRITAFRLFETAARKLPDVPPAEGAERASDVFREKTLAEALTGRNVRLPPAGVVARTSLQHFEATIRTAVENEIARLLAAAYASGTVSAATFMKAAQSTDAKDVRVPIEPTLSPSEAMRDPRVAGIRKDLVTETPAKNAFTVHPKGPGAPRGKRSIAKKPKKLTRNECNVAAVYRHRIEVEGDSPGVALQLVIQRFPDFFKQSRRNPAKKIRRLVAKASDQGLADLDDLKRRASGR